MVSAQQQSSEGKPRYLIRPDGCRQLDALHGGLEQVHEQAEAAAVQAGADWTRADQLPGGLKGCLRARSGMQQLRIAGRHATLLCKSLCPTICPFRGCE